MRDKRNSLTMYLYGKIQFSITNNLLPGGGGLLTTPLIVSSMENSRKTYFIFATVNV